MPYETISKLADALNRWVVYRGELVYDRAWDRTVVETLLPPMFEVSIPFRDGKLYRLKPEIRKQIQTEADMWQAAFKTQMLPQFHDDEMTRRALICIPFACSTLIHAFYRSKPQPRLTIYAYWRSIIDKKLPADLLLLEDFAKMAIEAVFPKWASISFRDRLRVYVQIGSFHSEEYDAHSLRRARRNRRAHRRVK